MACVPEWADVPLIGMKLMIEEPDLGEWGLCFWTSGFECLSGDIKQLAELVDLLEKIDWKQKFGSHQCIDGN